MKHILHVVALTALLPSTVLAAPIAFNLRDPSIELIDEVNSLALTVGDVTAMIRLP